MGNVDIFIDDVETAEKKIFVKEFTLNLAQAASTYTACTASGDVFIKSVMFYVATAGATFTSVSVQTNQTTATSLLTSGDGAVANLPAQKIVTHTGGRQSLLTLRNGQLITYTIAGSTGTGSLRMVVEYVQLTSGASLA